MHRCARQNLASGPFGEGDAYFVHPHVLSRTRLSSCTSVDLEAELPKVEDDMKRYEALAGHPLDDDTTVTVLISVCVNELRDRLEANGKGMSYKKVLGDIVAFIERRRDTEADGPKPMDIGNHEEAESVCYAPEVHAWWGWVGGDKTPLHG